MSRRITTLLIALVLIPSMTWAASYSGIIQSLSADGTRVTVKIPSKNLEKSFTLGKTSTLTLDGKAAKPDQLQVGQGISIFTDTADRLVTKAIARTVVAAKPAADNPPDESPLKPVTKATRKPTGKTPRDNDGDSVAPGDWPQYRGPQRDNISTETGLLDKWPQGGPALVWQIDGLGEGYSSLSLVGGTIFTMGTRGGDEFMIALNRNDGSVKWTRRTGSVRGDGQGGGPRGTPTVDSDRVYALGANGDLVCANVDTGEVVWELNILREFDGGNITWGISESVLIDGDRLICTPGGKAATVVALNKFTGKTIWKSVVEGTPQASYASPIAVDVGGVRQYVNFVHTAVIGVRATDGQPLWGNGASANGTANCSAPVADGPYVFTASGYGTGGALFQLATQGNQTRAEVKYRTNKMKNHHGGMVLHNGYLYGFDEQVLTCLDLRTGNPAWQDRSVGKGSLTVADGKLILRSEGGPLALATMTPKGYQELGRFDQPDRSNRPAWSHPVVAGGKLYLRDWDKLLVYELKP